MKNECRMLSGLCPDGKCRTKLFFPSYDSSIECTNCGQRHEQNALNDVQEITDHNVALHSIIRNVLLGNSAPKRGTEMVKVLGLSNYHCKLLSPFLTRYGMDKAGKAQLLVDLNGGEIFDCSVLGNRCFLIEPDHTEVVGYGRDVSGSRTYLADTLKMIQFYCNQDCLLPIHADGDGHCLVHAVSRALVGRELFWHPLRTSLKQHFETNLDKYKEHLRDFIDKSEWDVIIQECDSNFRPSEGELLGLRNIHIFGLANVLRRPIILLDSLQGMQSPGDYSATFLPGLLDPSECRGGKLGELNKPLCIAWSSSGRNHYIPLVGIKKKPLPRLPRVMVPKVWCMSQQLLDRYVDFDSYDFLIIGGDNTLKDNYILKLAAAMEDVFMEKHGVCPELVADVHHYIYKRTGFVGAQTADVLEATQKAVCEKRLFRCLTCDAILERKILPEWFRPGGLLYSLAEQRHGKLRSDKLYSFPLQGVTCSFDDERSELIPDGKNTMIEKCTWCQGTIIRHVEGNGHIVYKNGDRTKTSAKSMRCSCGQKHFWEGREYDNMPDIIPVTFEWDGKVIKEKVAWFQFESDPSMNSNAYQIADALVQLHFPGEFGTKGLEKKIVDQILRATKKPDEPQQTTSDTCGPNEETSPNKIILIGSPVVHKEELTMSNAEKELHQRIKDNAEKAQSKKSLGATSPAKPETQSMGIPVSPRQPAAKPSTVVRVATWDGRQLQINLSPQLTYRTFKEMLEIKLELPVAQQKIMYGFPPRELTAPSDGDEDKPLPFNPGDKILVDILQDKSGEKTEAAEPHVEAKATVDELLQSLQNSEEDASLTPLLLLKTLSGQPLWTYVQNCAEMFTAGGTLYSLMKKDTGLVDNRHCQLTILPDKVFRYNAAQDRFELCVRSHGHFEVRPGVEERALRAPPDPSACYSGDSTTTRTSVPSFHAGSSGMFVKDSEKVLAGHVPFQGHGYSLSGRAKIKENRVSGDGAADEDKMDTDSDNVRRDLLTGPKTLVRKGPGYSVLSTIPAAGHHTTVAQGSNTDMDEDMADGNT